MTHLLGDGAPVVAGVVRMADLSVEVAALADRTLLVLDDDAPLRTRLGRALEQRGFEPTLVASVQEALSAVRSSPPA